MIATVTLNPAIDYHIGLDELREGNSQSSKSNAFFAGGKGINVSRVLTNLGSPTKAISFIGGFTGEYILSQADDIIEAVRIKGLNRINTKIKTDSAETEIHGVAPDISDKEFEDLCNVISTINHLDIIVLSGSIPPSLKPDSYKKIANICNSSTKIVIDTRGKALQECLTLNSIFLVKPNKDEIGELFNCEVRSNEHALSLAKEMKQKYPIENLILSLGSEGAYFLKDDEIYFAETLKGTLVSSVGSGDSVVAGFTSKYLETQNPVESFKYAIACGGGTAFSYGLCSLETANELYSKVNIIKITQ